MNENNYGNPFEKPNLGDEENVGNISDPGDTSDLRNTSDVGNTNNINHGDTYSFSRDQIVQDDLAGFTSYANVNSNASANYNANTNMNWNQETSRKNKQKKNSSNNFGVKLVKCAAIALVFGLVSGGVFTGVSYAGVHLLGLDNTTNASSISSGNGDNASGNNAQTTDMTDINGNGPLQTTSLSSTSELIDVSDLVEEVMPSVVAITNTSTVTYSSIWGRQESYDSESCGSGIIIGQDEDYIYISSNNHVVEGADTLTVQFVDDTTVEAEVQGTAPSVDLAVIKVRISEIEKQTLDVIKVASIGDSTQLLVGDSAIAIGNALGYGQSVTTGVISALGRSVTVEDDYGNVIINNNLIQTDAAINPGNSGGALLNVKGEVIGINSVKYAETGVEGFGFAIPMEDAYPIIAQLIETGTSNGGQTAYLGIKGQDVTSDISQVYSMPEGVYIYEVIEGGAADEAGLSRGDIVDSIGGESVKTMTELQALLRNYEAGDEVEITFYRLENGEYKGYRTNVTLTDISVIQ